MRIALHQRHKHPRRHCGCLTSLLCARECRQHQILGIAVRARRQRRRSPARYRPRARWPQPGRADRSPGPAWCSGAVFPGCFRCRFRWRIPSRRRLGLVSVPGSIHPWSRVGNAQPPRGLVRVNCSTTLIAP
jgi:hypothetical protein